MDDRALISNDKKGRIQDRAIVLESFINRSLSLLQDGPIAQPGLERSALNER